MLEEACVVPAARGPGAGEKQSGETVRALGQGQGPHGPRKCKKERERTNTKRVSIIFQVSEVETETWFSLVSGRQGALVRCS